MNSHIDIEINKKPLVRPGDFSMSIEESNPLFNDTIAMHSDPVTAPMEGNRHIFQNVDDAQSDLRPISLEHLPALIRAEGMPLRSGVLSIQEDEELVDSFAFNIDQSTQTLSDLIGDLECRDIPLYNNERIPIGEKITQVESKIKMTIDTTISAAPFGGLPFPVHEEYDIEPTMTFDPQALGFSYPGKAVAGAGYNKDGKISYQTGGVKAYPEGITVNVPKVIQSYINVSEPYGSGWQYCNARVCYTHHGLDESKACDDIPVEDLPFTKVGTIGETTDEIMSADEDYSHNEDYGPYWVLDAHRPQSGICFYVLYFLDCLFHYLGLTFDKSALMEIEDLRRLAFFTTHCKYETEVTEQDAHLESVAAINQWLKDRGCGGQLQIEPPEESTPEEYTVKTGPFAGRTFTTDDVPEGSAMIHASKIWCNGWIKSATMKARVSTMYATNENFPDASVSTIISSLENSFGIRFHYDYEHRKVTAYLLRSVFRSQAEAIDLPCQVLSMNKLSEKITGVRVKYSAESDGTEQSRNVRTGKRDYDTDFDYIDYPESRTQVGEGYINIVKDRRTENLTVYIDRLTGNSYRWKISKESTTGNASEHRLFQVGQFKGIEEGDCSKENEDFIKEMVSDFQPMSWNDVNAYAEINRGSTQPVLAAYVDEDMEHEFVTQKINHPLYTETVEVYVTEVLQLIESYDPTQTEDGNSPLQSYDWGLAIGIMRGGGSDAQIQHYDFNYDFFGNARWRTIAGNYAMASDTMDQFGNTFDYNGEQEGIGSGERFSLMIRSYKQPDWADEPLCVADRSVRMRGLADTFLSEFIYFLLHRKKFRIHCLMEVSQLADIPNHWHQRFHIGDKTGFIDKMNYDLTVSEGVGEVTIDFFAL